MARAGATLGERNTDENGEEKNEERFIHGKSDV
jgi:hypothetical protein